MTRFKARVLGLVTVIALAIGIASIAFWQNHLLTVQAAEKNSTYIVQSGDSLVAIANKFGVSASALAEANGLQVTGPLFRMQKLVVPSHETPDEMAGATMKDAWAPSTTTPAEEKGSESGAKATGEATQEAATATQGVTTGDKNADVKAEAMVNAPSTTGTLRTYKVQAGDTLSAIAKKYHVTVEELMAANHLRPHAFLFRDMRLIIPGNAVSAAAAPQAAPSGVATAKPTEEATAEATAGATEEPTQEATTEATKEATAEPTEEATATAEITAEATQEPSVGATAEVTPAPSEQATITATETATETTVTTATTGATAEATPTVKEEAPITATETVTATEATTAEATSEATTAATEAATPTPPAEVPITATATATETTIATATEESTPISSGGATITATVTTTAGPIVVATPTPSEGAPITATATATETTVATATEENAPAPSAVGTITATETITAEATGESSTGTTEASTPTPSEGAPITTTEATTETTTATATEVAKSTPSTQVPITATATATETIIATATEESTPTSSQEAPITATVIITAGPTEAATPTPSEGAPITGTKATTETAPTGGATAVPSTGITETATVTGTGEATAVPTLEATTEPTGTAPITATETVTPVANILDTLTQMGDFKTFLAALAAAGLTDTLTTEGPFTLFAPNDAAFEALPAGAIDGLLATPPNDLAQILLYHLVPGEVLSGDLTDGTIIVTAQGGTVAITNTPDGIKVNNAKIIQRDIKTTNGVIHIIDAVLLPSAGTASVPPGTGAAPKAEAASGDAASVIIVPVSITDTTIAARFWPTPTDPIALYSPVDHGGYHSPIAITGLSKTFQGTLAISLETDDGTLLAQRLTLGGADDYAFFQSYVRFNVNDITAATLHALEIDMAEGTILKSIDRKITLLPGQRVIDMTSPVVGQAVCNPILVSGYSSTFEGNVVLTLSDINGGILTQIATHGGSMGSYRDFATPLPYTAKDTTPLLLSVAATDASGRFPTIDNTVAPVTLYPAISSVCY